MYCILSQQSEWHQDSTRGQDGTESQGANHKHAHGGPFPFLGQACRDNKYNMSQSTCQICADQTAIDGCSGILFHTSNTGLLLVPQLLMSMIRECYVLSYICTTPSKIALLIAGWYHCTDPACNSGRPVQKA